MAMGIPIFCNSGVGDTESVINQYQSGVSFRLEPNIDFNNIYLNLKHFNLESTKFGAEEFYGLKTGVARYLKVYKYLTSN